MCSGFGTVSRVPSPKSQAQAVGDPVEVSVKRTTSGAGPEGASSAKLAVRGGSAVKTWTRLAFAWVT